MDCTSLVTKKRKLLRLSTVNKAKPPELTKPWMSSRAKWRPTLQRCMMTWSNRYLSCSSLVDLLNDWCMHMLRVVLPDGQSGKWPHQVKAAEGEAGKRVWATTCGRKTPTWQTGLIHNENLLFRIWSLISVFSSLLRMFLVMSWL